MKRYILSILTLLLSLSVSAQWKNYLSYYEATEIEQATEDVFFVLASGDLYSYNTKDKEVVTYDKTTVLSDCSISHIAWCKAAKRLVIVYDNYNIDLLSLNGDVVNMTAYMDATLTEDKTVNNIDIVGKYAYLSTEFGLVQLDVADAEFTNTYNLGFRVNYCYVEDNYIYAESNIKGRYRGLLTDNLLDPTKWTWVNYYTARQKTMDPDLLAIHNSVRPEGPQSNSIGYLRFYNNKIYTTSALLDITETPGYIQIYDGNSWTFCEDYASINSKTGCRFASLFSLEIDPNDENHLYVGSQSGLYEFENLKFTKQWTNDNSPLRTAATVSDNTDKNYVIVPMVKYDANGELWVFNSISAGTSLFKLSSSGEWTSYNKDAFMITTHTPKRSFEMVTCPYVDSRKYLWMLNAYYREPSVIRYQPSTDDANVVKEFINEDGTKVDFYYLRCITEDNEGNMWIGTSGGPMMIETDQITATTPTFTQVKVPRNDGTGLADYLLSGVDILSIAIDNQNRKWFGTNGNGVYVVSSNNIQQVEHFTTENSKLLSDVVRSICFDKANNTVYMATDNGLCSYTGTINSSEDGMTKDNVYAYPNPVRPDYKGVITITGLENGAYVKIATSNGTLVNEGTASSGTYKWYGLDKDGKRVASGVYMVEVSTAEGEKGVVCKIAIVN